MDLQLVDALNRIVIIVACAGGAYSSFAFGTRIKSRSLMFQLWIACVFLGYAFSVVTNAAIHYWLPKFDLNVEVRASIGAIVSCIMRYLIPEVFKRIGPFLDRIPFFKHNKE